MTAIYRIQQGLRALFAFSRPVDDSLAGQHLSPPLMACFQAMRRSEQLHSLHVLRTLTAQGFISNDLAVAALLHDAGKSRYPFPVWQKTLVVLVEAFAPGWFERLSNGDETNSFQRPFVLSHHHPRWSADMVRDAGGSECAVWLIEHHAESAEAWSDHRWGDLLTRLQMADNAN
jgi:hypothetical protein